MLNKPEFSPPAQISPEESSAMAVIAILSGVLDLSFEAKYR